MKFPVVSITFIDADGVLVFVHLSSSRLEFNRWVYTADRVRRQSGASRTVNTSVLTDDLSERISECF